MREVIAVDFDGTLCENAHPNIGELLPMHKTIHEYIRMKHKNGALIILWTCRCGKELEAAISFCKKYNIPIDYVNENDPERVKKYGYDSRKISADLYIDDKAFGWRIPLWGQVKTSLVKGWYAQERAKRIRERKRRRL